MRKGRFLAQWSLKLPGRSTSMLYSVRGVSRCAWRYREYSADRKRDLTHPNMLKQFLQLIILFYSQSIQSTEKAMAPHSSALAWKIPWMEERGRLQSMGSLRVGHDWATSLLLFTYMHWRRKWQPTLVFLPGESQGRWSLVGCRLWGRTESDTTEET